MGLTTLGTTAKNAVGAPIVIRGVTPTSLATNQVTHTRTRTLIPKGAYVVTIVPSGSGSTGSSPGSVTTSLSSSMEYTVITSYADNGRPGPFLHGADESPISNMLILSRDAFAQVGVKNESSYATFLVDVVFTPTYTPFKSLGSFTGNRTSTSTGSSTQTTDVQFASAQIGWDYDRNAPMAITSGTSTLNGERTRTQDFYLWRYNSDGTWGFTYWNQVSAATGNTWREGNGIGFRGNQNNYRQSAFFIKNNFLHNLDMSAMMVNTASGLAYGWIKGDISSGTTAGATLTMSPGHTNSAFGSTSTSIDTGTQNIMLYYHDKVNNKVIYNGARSSAFNGTWGVYPWIHHWAQWDIQTDTVDYANSNGTKDPRIAGLGSYMAYDYGVPNGSTGITYATGDNGGNAYLARWDRSGTYTGVGNFQSRQNYNGSTNISAYNGSPLTYYNTITYMPNGVMVCGQNMLWASIDHLNTSLNQPIATTDNSFQKLGFWGLNSPMGTGQVKYHVIVVNNMIAVMQIGYMKYTNNAGSVARTVPITIYVAPATTANLGSILPNAGGIGSAANGNPGINNGA